jgi:hypothetical protein
VAIFALSAEVIRHSMLTVCANLVQEHVHELQKSQKTQISPDVHDVDLLTCMDVGSMFQKTNCGMNSFNGMLPFMSVLKKSGWLANLKRFQTDTHFFTSKLKELLMSCIIKMNSLCGQECPTVFV